MSDVDATTKRVAPDHVRVVRLGHGANCSSLGSVVDTLFATAVVGGALFVAISAALEKERPAPAKEEEEATPSAPEDEAKP